MTAENWRDRDLAGGRGPVPASVSEVVRRTHMGLRAALLAECTLLGVGAWTLSLAALVESGAQVDRWDAWCAGLVSAVALGASWFLGRRLVAEQVAGRLDERLRHQGALVTAFELEQKRPVRTQRPMERLLIARVLQRLRTREALRVLLPSVVLPVTAPLLGAGLLALSLDARRVQLEMPVDLAGLRAGIQLAVGAVEGVALEGSEQGWLDAESAREVLSVIQRAQSAARDLERQARAPLSQETSSEDERGTGGTSREGALESELARLDRELARLDARLADRPEMRAAIGEARNWLDAARTGLQRANGSPEELASRGALDATAGRSEGGPSKVEGRSEGRSEPARILGPEGSSASKESDPSLGAGHPRGTLAPSSWPAEYDGIVSRWVELVRDSGSELR